MSRFSIPRSLFLTAVLAAVLAVCAVAAPAALAQQKQASPDDLLLTSTRIDNYSLIVPKANSWKALNDAPKAPSCAAQLWKLFVDKDFVERPVASNDLSWAIGILAATTPKGKVLEWAAEHVVADSGILVTDDYVLCAPTVEQARSLGILTVGKRQAETPKAQEAKESKLPLKLPDAGDLGFVQGFFIALKFWQEAPSADNVAYAAGKYAGTAVLIIAAGIVALFLVMFIIKKTIKTAFVLALKIIFWPICCLFRRKKRED